MRIKIRYNRGRLEEILTENARRVPDILRRATEDITAGMIREMLAKEIEREEREILRSRVLTPEQHETFDALAQEIEFRASRGDTP